MALRKYPWEKWFGQPRTILQRGIDYQLSQSMMYQTIKNNSRLRKVKIRLIDIWDGIVIEVIKANKNEIPHSDYTTVVS